MRARARQAIEILKAHLLQTGTVEPLVALYFDDHIEQVQFEDPSVLDHFDLRTARSFDYLRTLVGIRTPQAAMVTLDVRMGPFENDEREVVAEKTAIFLMLDSPPSHHSDHPALQTFRWEGRRVRSSLHGEAGNRKCVALPDLQDFH